MCELLQRVVAHLKHERDALGVDLLIAELVSLGVFAAAPAATSAQWRDVIAQGIDTGALLCVDDGAAVSVNRQQFEPDTRQGVLF